ncbi:hypothetical protein FHQ28_05010 [Pasteurellaceae bacterium USgator11]|nr:hypothetical protein FHQ19_08480 [Pasteurellaceae bacterium UScroc12]TNG97440.1 hypothetical protein FHQ20_03120 [Pasteurellaceae bacterium USgator41]TNH00173.1 hypothetical protein FHQ24_04270 [Pasteurellaceae bacterium UScroc31]TNH01787.1 hypothetical protein FHQ28_05010 [Pasteurellaceae bacterium USgator11]
MNKTYKVIWSKVTQEWVAVSEIIGRKGKASRGKVSRQVEQRSWVGMFTGCALTAIASALAISLGMFISLPTSAATLTCTTSTANNSGNVICGNSSTAHNSQSVVVGSSASAGGEQSVAVGANTSASGSSSIAIGGDDLDIVAGNNNSSASAIAYKTLTGDNLIDYTNNSTQYPATQSSGGGAVAVGVQAIASGDLATAFGSKAKARALVSVALGVGANASQKNAVALGAGSTTTTSATSVTSATVGTGVGAITYSNFGGANVSAGDQVSVGKVGYERQIKNVAPGEVSASSTDAINGSQLYSVANTLQTKLTNYYSVNSTNTAAGSNYANDGATGINALAAGMGTTASGAGAVAIGSNATKGAQATGTDSIAIGGQSAASGGGTIAIGNLATGTFANTVAIGVSTNATGFDSVVLGSGAQALSGGANIAIGKGAYTNGTTNGNGTNISIGSAAGVGQTTAANGNVAIGGSAGQHVSGSNNFAAMLDAGQYVSGNNNIAIGQNAGKGTSTAPMTASHTVALGTNSVANKGNAIAIGNVAQATGLQSISIGTGNVVSGDKSGALGDPSYISGSGTYTIGNNNGTSAQPIAANNSGAFGNNNAMIVGGSSGIRIVGNNNNVSSSNVMVLGNNVIVGTGLDGAVVLGNDSTVSKAVDTAKTDLNGLTYTYATAGAAPADGDVVSVGKTDKPRQIQNVANGQVSATSLDAINGSQLYAVADTLSQQLTHFYSVNNTTTTAGNYNNDGATGTNAMALGPNAKAVGAQSIAMGLNAQTSDGADSVAIGHESNASTGSVAMGRGTVANGQNAVAIGLGAQATSAESDNFGGVAIGGQSKATTPTGALYTATSIGYSSQATTDGALALGDSAKATVNAGDVALGSNSSTAAVVNTTEATVGKLTYSGFAGTAATSTVSVGSVGNERTLTNVAAGRISQTSTDAINGSQLYATNLTLGNVATTAVGILGGNAALAADGTITMTNIGDTGKTTVHDAIKAAKTEVAAGTNVTSVVKTEGANGQAIYTVNADGTTVSAATSAVTVSADPKDGATNITNYKVDLSQETKDSIAKADSALQSWTAQVNGTTAKTIDKDNTTLNFVNGDNILITNDNGGIKVSTSMTPTFTSVNATTITAPTISTGNGGPSMTTTGIDAGSQKITNVTAGSADTDAVNYSQLKAVQDAAKTSSVVKGTNVASVTSTTTGVNTEYTVNADGTTVSGTGAVKVTAGDKNPTTNVTDYALDLTDDTKADIAKGVTAATKVDALGNSTATNLGGGAVYNSTTGTVSAPTYTTTKTDGTTVNATNVGDALTNLNNEVIKPITFAGDSGDNVTRKLGETANIKGGATDLSDNNIGVVANGADTLTIKLAKNLTGLTDVETASLSVGDTVTITSAGIDAGSKVITNVADGVNDDDAVNMSQLNKVAGGWEIGQDTTAAKVGNVAAGKRVDFVSGNEESTLVDVAQDADGNSVVTVEAAPGALRYSNSNTAAGGNVSTGDQFTATDSVTLVGKDGNTSGGVTINNVAPAELSANSKQAVNGSQLFATNTNVTTNATNITNLQTEVGKGWNVQANATAAEKVAMGDTVKFINGKNIEITQNGKEFTIATAAALVADSLTITNGPVINAEGINAGSQQITAVKSGVDGTTLADAAGDTLTNAANIGDVKNAITNLETQYQGDNTTVTVTRKPAEVLSITGGATDLTDNNIGTVGNADGSIAVKLAKNLSGLTDVATESLSVGDKVTITSAGIDAGGLPITNVADGVNDDDAVNMSQLNKVAGGWEIGNDITAAKVGNVAAGKRVDFVSGNEESTLVTVAQGADGNSVVTVEAAPGALRYSNTNTAAGGNVSTGDQFTATDSVTLVGKDGNTSGGVTINNVAPAELSANSKQAVNGSQLFETNTNVATNAANIAKGINFGGTEGSNKYALGDTINVKGDSNITSTTIAGGAQLALANTVTIGNATTGKPVTINGEAGTVGGLTNTTFDAANITSGQAATEDQLKAVSEVANAGWNVQANNTTAENVAPKDTVTFKDGKNILVTQEGKTLTIATSENPEFSSVKIGDATNNTTLTSTDKGLDVGGDKITNVATGTADTDAVNVAQLNEVAGAAAKPLTFAGNSRVAADGTSDVERKLGETLKIYGAADGSLTALSTDAATAGTYSGKNIQTITDKTTGAVQIQLAENPEFTSVKIGDTTNNTTLTSTANGLDVGDDKITNLKSGLDGTTLGNASGAVLTNAVNVADLQSAVTGLTDSGFKVNADNADVKTHKLGNELAIVAGNATDTSSDNLATKVEQDAQGKTTVTVSMKNAPTFTGTVTAPTFVTSGNNPVTIGDGKVTGLVAPTEDGDAANKKYVDDQVTNINTTVDAVALNTAGDSGAGNVNLKTQTLSVTGTADQIETTAAEQGIKLKLSDKVTDSLAKADNAVQYDDPTKKDSVTLGGTGSTTPVQLTNVKAGDLSANSTDAVNGSQLFATNQNIETLQKGWNVTTSQSDGAASGSAVTAVKAEDTVTIDAGKNIVITQDGQKVSIATSATPEFSSVKIGDATNNTTLTSTANGLDVGGDKITNVGSGTVAADSSDAVNGGDVYTAIQNTETQYQGDNTTVTVKRKPTDVLSVKGGATGELTDNNIGTVGAEDGSITVKLAKNLTGLEKVTVGDSELTSNGLTISNGTAGNPVSLTKDGLNNGGNQITNVKSGLDGTTLGDATGAVLTNAVNVADLQSAVTGLTNSGFKVNADQGGVQTHKLGNELAIVAGNTTDATSSDNLLTKVEQDAVSGKTTVTVSMKESPTFKDITATSVTADDGAGNVTKLTATGTSVTDGTNTSTYGADGLVIKDKDGKEVASLDSTPITVKDNDGNDITNINTALNQLNSVQQTADSFAVKYDKNADGTPNKDSVTLAGTEATATKDDTTGVITTTGGTSLNNVASAGDISDVANANKAVNAADLNNQVVNLTNKGLIFGANDGTDYTAKLGSTVAVKGADSNTDFSKFDAGQNIMTQIDNGLIRVALAKDLSGLDSVTVGKDANGNTTVLNGGGTTVTNDDGRTASYGVDGMNVKGADGTTLASVGKDGVSTTGTVKVVDGDGKTVAQLDNTAMNVAGKPVTSVNDAINQLDKAATAAKTTVTAGDNIVVTPTTNSDGSTTYNVATAKDLKVDSVKAGDTTINNDGLTIAGGPSVTKAGIDAAGTKITNVASGDISATSTDAVNGGDVHNAIKNATSDLVDSGLKFGANSGDTYTAKLGSTVNVKGADSNTDFSKFDGGKNIMTQVDTKGNITVALANDVEVASAKFGDTVKIDNNGINAGNTVIDGVKAGSIAAGSQQAVNGGQVRDVAESVAKALGDGAKVNPDGTVTAPTYTITKTDGSTVTANSVGGALNYFNQEIVKPITFTGDSGSYDAKLGNTVNVKGDGKNISTAVSGNNLTISMTDTPEFSRVTTGGTVMNSNGLTTGGGNGPSLTTSGINAAGTKISNVANATEAGDAVNFGQVQAMGNNLSRRINEVDKNARAGIAGALATAGLYQAYLPGKSMVSVGAGTYRGENALAIGVSRISDNGKIGVKLTGMSTSQGDAGGSVSVGYQW